jgi:radical SAM superfamily enzyme YgiQ (UPF0313 family)
MAKKLLLTGVFGPFGVDDQFGRKENVMELFHNQVTKAQGIASLRFHHRSFGLYFLAENVEAPVKILDFPSRARFIKELEREQYDAIGISFIAPNFIKAREMSAIIRKMQPKAEIILGGHGAAIEGVEKLIDCDHVVKGEGIRWLRRYLGEKENRPIKHPALAPAHWKRVFGIPAPVDGGLLVPGVGCVNGCRFCSTTHFFGKDYTSFFSTGEELYRHACRISVELGCDEFFVMDENFLKNKERAMELLALMERDSNPFKFSIFSSAEAIEAFGVENMVRLGIYFVWIGAESKRDIYDKNKGRDLKALVAKLREHGISVLVSGILFLEHHTRDNIWEDIDYIIGLGGDFTQFMMFTPLPVTALYDQLKQKGLIDFDLPYEEWHGQHMINWRHPHFGNPEAGKVLQAAFQAEFDRLSSSIYRTTQTVLRGYQKLKEAGKKDRWLGFRRDQMKRFADMYRVLIPTMKRFAHDELELERLRELERAYNETFGKMNLKQWLTSIAARAISEVHSIRSALFGDMTQPKCMETKYRWKQAVEKKSLVLPVSLPVERQESSAQQASRVAIAE